MKHPNGYEPAIDRKPAALEQLEGAASRRFVEQISNIFVLNPLDALSRRIV